VLESSVLLLFVERRMERDELEVLLKPFSFVKLA